MEVHNGVSDEEYQQLLRQAHAGDRPPARKVAGLPVVEAQAAGCPAVISDIPIFRELRRTPCSRRLTVPRRHTPPTG